MTYLSHLRSGISFLVLCLSATPACQIVTETFSIPSDGTTADNRTTARHQDTPGVPDALYFAVRPHRLQAEEVDWQITGYSKAMDLPGYPNFCVTIKINTEGNLIGSRYAKIWRMPDNGSEILSGPTYGFFKLSNRINQSLYYKNIPVPLFSDEQAFVLRSEKALLLMNS